MANSRLVQAAKVLVVVMLSLWCVEATAQTYLDSTVGTQKIAALGARVYPAGLTRTMGRQRVPGGGPATSMQLFGNQDLWTLVTDYNYTWSGGTYTCAFYEVYWREWGPGPTYTEIRHMTGQTGWIKSGAAPDVAGVTLDSDGIPYYPPPPPSVTDAVGRKITANADGSWSLVDAQGNKWKLYKDGNGQWCFSVSGPSYDRTYSGSFKDNPDFLGDLGARMGMGDMYKWYTNPEKIDQWLTDAANCIASGGDPEHVKAYMNGFNGDTTTDTDGDGVPDYRSDDIDGDGAKNANEVDAGSDPTKKEDKPEDHKPGGDKYLPPTTGNPSFDSAKNRFYTSLQKLIPSYGGVGSGQYPKFTCTILPGRTISVDLTPSGQYVDAQRTCRSILAWVVNFGLLTMVWTTLRQY